MGTRKKIPVQVIEARRPPVAIVGPKFLEKVVPYISRARSTIDICVYDWRIDLNDAKHPVSKLLQALREAQARGVHVRVLHMHEPTAKVLSDMGFEVKRVYTRKLMHCKMMLLDSRYAIVGSHNYTLSAFTENLEVSAAIDMENEENELQAFFTNRWGV